MTSNINYVVSWKYNYFSNSLKWVCDLVGKHPCFDCSASLWPRGHNDLFSVEDVAQGQEVQWLCFSLWAPTKMCLKNIMTLFSLGPNSEEKRNRIIYFFFITSHVFIQYSHYIMCTTSFRIHSVATIGSPSSRLITAGVVASDKTAASAETNNAVERSLQGSQQSCIWCIRHVRHNF